MTGQGRQRLLAAAAVTLALGWSTYSTVALQSEAAANGEATQALAAKEAEIARMKTAMAGMQAEVGALKQTVSATVTRLETRQAALAAIVEAGRAPTMLASATRVSPPAAMPASATALLAPLSRLEGQQLALIDQATAATRARHQSATAIVRGLGLNPERFDRATPVAMGGPEESAEEGDEKVYDLYLAWQKLANFQKAAEAIPSHLPVASFRYTSNYGVRYDPFNGRAAMHSGVDMAGSHGEPIMAAAEGVVTRAGWWGGYGNVIEVDHGRGMSTRYGHLSKVQVRVGDRVAAGDQIGRMGSTGRSTGTHLHFEVRVDGDAVDPMPYLRAAPQIAAVKASIDVAQGGPAQSSVAVK